MRWHIYDYDSPALGCFILIDLIDRGSNSGVIVDFTFQLPKGILVKRRANNSMWMLIVHSKNKSSPTFIAESHYITQNTSPALCWLRLITATVREGSILRLLELDLILRFSAVFECFNRPFFTHASLDFAP